jgi:hypothetical protein
VENIFLKYLYTWQEEMNNHEENLMKKDKEVEEVVEEMKKT